ncbi:MAG TPA: rhodanese-like domain-containing protein [Acetobacteraceae bacterium]|nr:rhodanese-like domain-containing protein [Acetobacteraceae bacterium]
MRHLGARRLLLVMTVAAAVSGAAAETVHVPEPHGYWLGPIHGPVPATITGGTVLDTARLEHLLASGGAVLVDVSEAPYRPSGLPAGTLWLPPPHRDIPGSVWIPNVGRGTISPRFAAWFHTRLATLTGGNPKKPIVVYCHTGCWLSWNAARRVINDGYRTVFWFPGGMEDWKAAGHPTAVIKPEGPDAR